MSDGASLKNQRWLTVLSIHSFEHSLVQELGYNGYERLRRGFDRAFGGQNSVPTFPLVVDAGCGTGLVGEQVGVIYVVVGVGLLRTVPCVFVSQQFFTKSLFA